MNALFKSFTGMDNETLDIGRILIALSVLDAIFLVTFQVTYKGMVFDIQQFGSGMGLLLAGGGGMLFLKRNTEPTAPNSVNKGS